MEYQWKTTDVWGLNHLVDDPIVACFESCNTIHESTLIHHYDNHKSKCPKCKLFLCQIIDPCGPNVLHINRKIFI